MSDSIWSKIKGVIGTVAPAVASVIGTPIAGVAVKGLCDILGLTPDATPDQIEHSLKNASADQWIKIKELESETEIRLKELDIDAAKISQMERESARDREVKMAESGNRDFTPSILALIITIGFFGLLGIMVFYPIPMEVKYILEIMLGLLGTGFITMLNYYFGSSSSSRKKDEYLALKK